MKNTLMLLLVAAALNGQPIESYVLAGNWAGVLRTRGAELDQDVRVMLRAHAELLAGEHNRAVCAFAAQTPVNSTNWVSWTESFATSHPDSPIAQYLLGDALARREDWEGAAAAFTRALGRDPAFGAARNARGVVAVLQGHFDRGLVDLRLAAREPALRVEALTNTGFLYLAKKGPAAGALNAFEDALAAQPYAGLAMAGRAFALGTIGRFEDSRKAVANALSVPGCFTELIEDNTMRLAKWVGGQSDHHLAALNPDEVGSTVTRELVQGLAGKGDPAAIRRALTNAAGDPTQQKRVANLLSKAATPQNEKAIAQGIKAFESGSTFKKGVTDLLSNAVVKAGVDAKAGASAGTPSLTVKSKGVSVDVNTGAKAGAEVSGGIGVTAKLGKALAPVKAAADRDVNFAKDLTKTVPAVANQAGGVTTDLTLAYVDRGQWPFQPQFALGYRNTGGGK